MSVASQKEIQEQNTIRILVLGETNTGKTLLIKRLCHELFNDDASAPIFFRSRWSSTVGFYLDTLIRDVDDASGGGGGAGANLETSSVGTTSGGGRGGVMSTLSSALKLRSPSSALPKNFAAAGSVPSSLRRSQVIELYEVGSSQSLNSGCWLTAQTIPFDGVILLHNRRDVNSLAYLVDLYQQLRGNILRSSPCASLLHQDGEGGGEAGAPRVVFHTESSPGSKAPLVLLVGAELSPRPHLFTRSSSFEDLTEAAELPDEAYVGANFQEETARRQPAQGKRATASEARSVWWLLWGQWSFALLWVELLLHPAIALSLVFQEQKEQYIKERSASRSGCQSTLTYLSFCAVEIIAHGVHLMDQLLYYCMAVALFGPFQRVAALQHHRCEEMEAMLRRDTQCVASINCFLYSRSVLAQSTDEFTAYFNLLHKRKLSFTA